MNLAQLTTVFLWAVAIIVLWIVLTEERDR